MIKVEELRVGNALNYVTSEGNTAVSIMDWQDIKWISEDSKGFNLVHSPILITNDILIEADFQTNKHNDFIFWKNYKQQGELILFTPNHPMAKSNEVDGYYFLFNGVGHFFSISSPTSKLLFCIDN